MCFSLNVCTWSPLRAFQTRAEKSAEAVAASIAGSFRMQDHTAPCRSTQGVARAWQDERWKYVGAFAAKVCLIVT